MKSSLILIGLLLFLFLHSTSATPQESDTLIHEGASYPVSGFRFSPELNKKLYRLSRNDERWIRDSRLWRGYSAVLQVRDGRLYLMGVNFNCVEPRPTPAQILGFDIPDKGRLAAEFTGELFYGFGDSWGYMHSSSAGEQRKHIRKFSFAEGKLTGITTIKTKKPRQILKNQIARDIEMLSEILEEVDANDPFSAEPPKVDRSLPAG